MINIPLWFPVVSVVVWLLFFAEGRVLDPAVPIRGHPTWEKQTLNVVNDPDKTWESNGRQKRSIAMTREERLDHLCEAFETFSGGHTAHREHFGSTGLLEGLMEDRLRELDLALEQRRFHTSNCCSKTRDHRYRCFDDIRIRRIDQLCGDGYSKVPFNRHSRDWHSRRQTHCCDLLGMERIECFLNTRAETSMGSTHQDELDPANDYPQYMDRELHQSQEELESDLSTSNEEYRGTSHTTTRFTTPTLTQVQLRRQERRQNRKKKGRSRAQSQQAVISDDSREDICCVAGDVAGLEVESNQYHRCSQLARGIRHLSPGDDMCETMFRSCCLRVSLRRSRPDNDGSSVEGLLAYVIQASGTTVPDRLHPSEQSGRLEDSREDHLRNLEVADQARRSSIAPTTRRRHGERRLQRGNQRSLSPHHNSRRSHRRGRRRDRERA